MHFEPIGKTHDFIMAWMYKAVIVVVGGRKRNVSCEINILDLRGSNVFKRQSLKKFGISVQHFAVAWSSSEDTSRPLAARIAL